MSLNRKNDSEFQFFQKYLWGFDIKLCQEGWHRPALSLFAKVSLAFSCALPKTACFQNFLLTPLDFCGSLSQRSIAIQLFGCHIGNKAADFPCSGVSAHHQQDLIRRKVHSKMLAGNPIQYRQRFDLFLRTTSRLSFYFKPPAACILRKMRL